MQGHLEGMIGKPSGLIESLPKTLRNRLAYLGELQDQHDELAEKLHEEQVALQRKYEKLWGEFLNLQSCFCENMNVQVNSLCLSGLSCCQVAPSCCLPPKHSSMFGGMC